MAAKAKVIDRDDFVKIATAIKEKHALVQRESDAMDMLKAQLVELAKKEFFLYLKSNFLNGKPTTVLEGVPEVYGNFEVPVDNNDKVTINFQVGSKSFSKIDSSPAPSILKGMFGAEPYKQLFVENKDYEVVATENDLDEQAEQNPTWFQYSFYPESDPVLLNKLYKEYPDLIVRSVSNLKSYAEKYSINVKTETKVSLSKGFLEKVGKADASSLENAKKFLAGIFGAILKASIICGNANKK